MSFDTYANLQTEIASWAFRTGDAEFAAAVPGFIALLEDALHNGTEGIPALRVREMEASATVAMTDGAGSLPADYLQFRTVKDGTTPLAACDPNWGEERYRDGSGVGRFFAIIGSTIRTYPASSNSLTLDYYQKIPDLATNSTNWLLAKAPRVYLFGSLLMAEAFMREDERVGRWGSLFQGAVSGLVGSDAKAKLARASVRVAGATP